MKAQLSTPTSPSRHQSIWWRAAIAAAALCAFSTVTGCYTPQPAVPWSFDLTRAALDYYPVGDWRTRDEGDKIMSSESQSRDDNRVETILEYASLPFGILPVVGDLIALPLTGARDAVVFGLAAMDTQDGED